MFKKGDKIQLKQGFVYGPYETKLRKGSIGTVQDILDGNLLVYWNNGSDGYVTPNQVKKHR